MLCLRRVSGVGKVRLHSSVDSARMAHSRQRAYHDLVNLPTQKPVISYGPPGYSAVSGHTVTVFGATGFLGRYLVSKLGMQGCYIWFSRVI
jgi:membrane-associated phospholipid phosphatase